MSLSSLDQKVINQFWEADTKKYVTYDYVISLAILRPESCANSTSVISVRLKARPDADAKFGSPQ